MALLKLTKYIAPSCVVPRLEAETKQEAIEELLRTLQSHVAIEDLDAVRKDVFERENQMSTGLTEGLAIPHAKSGGTKAMAVAVGLKPEGVEFDSLDGKPARVVFLVVSRVDRSGPHLECLAEIAQFYSNAEARERLLRATTAEGVINALSA